MDEVMNMLAAGVSVTSVMFGHKPITLVAHRNSTPFRPTTHSQVVQLKILLNMHIVVGNIQNKCKYTSQYINTVLVFF